MYLGNPSARVRDKLWELAVSKTGAGSVIQIWTDRCPQGYRFRSHGTHERELVDLEGIALVRRRRRDNPEPPGQEELPLEEP